MPCAPNAGVRAANNRNAAPVRATRRCKERESRAGGSSRVMVERGHQRGRRLEHREASHIASMEALESVMRAPC